MAYFNFTLAHSKGLTPNMIILLQLIKQNKTEDNLSPFIAMMVEDEVLDILEQDGIVEYIKGNKKQTQFEKIRLSSKGLSLLEDLETPEILEEDVLLAEWLKSVYQKESREIGNFKKTKMYIALFRVNSGINKNRLAYLCQSFMNDEKSFEYSRKLEYLFWKPSHMYNTKFDINDSKLYQFYLNRESYFIEKFKTIN